MNIVFPWPNKDLNPNSRCHWAKKMKIAKGYRSECFTRARSEFYPHMLPMPSIGKIHLFVDFIPPDKRRRDDDNIFAAFKSGRDGLAQALGVDDSRFVSHPFLSGTETVKGGEVRVKITMIAPDRR